MGCDIHWIAERLHADGTWEAAFSEDHCSFLAGEDRFTSSYWDTVQSNFGGRDYQLFGLLSQVRGSANDVFGEIAHSGLPDDASEHTRINFAEDDGDLHSHGYFTVARLKAALDAMIGHPDGETEFKDDIEVIQEYLKQIEQMLKDEGSVPIKVDNILIGESRDDEYETTFPDMAKESSHAKIARTARIKELLPPDDNTLRFIIAYDN